MSKKWLALLLAAVMALCCAPMTVLADAGEVEHIVVWSDNAHEQTVREKQIEEFASDYTRMEELFRDKAELEKQVEDLYREWDAVE